MLYDFFLHGSQLHDICKRHEVKYNTVRNFVKSFRKETGFKYKYMHYDRSNPIDTTPRAAAEDEEVPSADAVGRTKFFPFLHLGVGDEEGDELTAQTFEQLQKAITTE